MTFKEYSYKRECIGCSKLFRADKRYSRNGTERYPSFCSVKCRQTHKSIKPIDCQICGISFTRKSKGKFCSLKCAGINNTLTTILSGKSLLTHTYHYSTKAYIYKGLKCEECNWDKEKELLHVHHKRGKKNGNDLDNLEVLCPLCHARRHIAPSVTSRERISVVESIRKLYKESEYFRRRFSEATGKNIELLEGLN